MATIQKNSTVTLAFTGKLDNGEIFKTVTQESPMVITLGDAEVPPTLESALVGMSAGESKSVRLPPEEGFGPRQKDLLQTLDKSSFGENVTPKPGMLLSLNVEKDGENHKVPATVIEVTDASVTVDYNHPLAGHTLTYELMVINVQ